MNCIPASPANGSCNGLFVIVSARGDMRTTSSEKSASVVLACRSGITSFFSVCFGGAHRLKGVNPKLPGELLNLCVPNPGEGGGFENGSGGGNPGDIGGRESDSGAGPGDGGNWHIERGAKPGDGGGFENALTDATLGSSCGGFSIRSRLNRPNFPGSFSSSFSAQEKLEGAEDGPGEIGSPLPGVDVPRARAEHLSGEPT